MSGNRKALMDSNVLINFSKKTINSEALYDYFDELNISMITYMESYGFPFSNIEEKMLIDEIVTSADLLEIDLTIADKVIEYRKQKRKKIKLPDAIILATASVHRLALLTDDWDDFQGIDEAVEIVQLERFKK
jgi:predicted nucleic acid-binding protein